ncbi:MAG: AbrB/MazE/SpoVT family DNA-binding domain-containing protein [Gemmatimonadetes bacterium]|nr:AbrB/MazE/SpoVT family DNA-binding domain-containing protein [Gemmatimonadota bacterium]
MHDRPNALESGAPRRAKLFWNGRSQAVRLPREFRFEGDEVLIRKEGANVILEPIGKRAWPAGYWDWVGVVREELELGDIEPLGGGLLDISIEADE